MIMTTLSCQSLEDMIASPRNGGCQSKGCVWEGVAVGRNSRDELTFPARRAQRTPNVTQWSTLSAQRSPGQQHQPQEQLKDRQVVELPYSASSL